MSDIVVKKKNEVYLTLKSEPHIHHELSDYFSFELPEAKFLKRQPRFKYWDGMIRLYSPGTGELYGGLLNHLKSGQQKKNVTASSLKRMNGMAKRRSPTTSCQRAA